MAVIIFAAMGIGLGLLLGVASRVFLVPGDPLVDRIESLMPGGQCGQCGKAGCRQAAEAMVKGELAPNECPPGGSALSAEITKILGVSLSGSDESVPSLAAINETQCTGCTRCNKACPFDAIVGATKQIHVVIKDTCTGCALCVNACPEQCIELNTQAQSPANWVWPKPILERS
ncbi:RnfABCDGE type electron transport complex subunit B [Vibrio agarivorans]|uniref:Ion-translocating oxidoreductase complex subunit B n=1 Tax=Vibrio agarivorans TaxID=153622 RepID=A0ABT7XZM3_9VIBR|nr:RnfABCDGE type electron transport complex subunit B [Vibrio agarivorans]MDN2481221.1 RnfABCDGE type electron transport complex subunit B [Vibrio agarivorans]